MDDLSAPPGLTRFPPQSARITGRLSAEVRRRLETRGLRLQMWLRFQPLAGEATELRTTIRAPS